LWGWGVGWGGGGGLGGGWGHFLKREGFRGKKEKSVRGWPARAPKEGEARRLVRPEGAATEPELNGPGDAVLLEESGKK